MKPLIKKARSFLRKKGYDIVRHKELPEWLNLHGVDIVLDIGANDGRYAREIREAGWHGPIISFEPQPSSFKRLELRMKSDPKWRGLQIGLGNQDAKLKLNSYELDVLSSFLPKKIKDQRVREVEVIVKRAEGIVDGLLNGCARPFVKIDTQGYEMEIIRGFGAKIREVVGWQLELSVEPLYEGQPLIEEMIGMMRESGFSLWKILPGLRDPQTHQAFELDGIFFHRK